MIKINGLKNNYNTFKEKKINVRLEELTKEQEQEKLFIEKLAKIEKKAKELYPKLIGLSTNNLTSSLFYGIVKSEIIIVQYYKEKISEYISFDMKAVNNSYVSRSEESSEDLGFEYSISFNIMNIKEDMEILDIKKEQAVELLNIITGKCIKNKAKKNL